MSANRWTAGSTSRKPQAIDPDSPELVDRKVKGLLNKLTMEKFDSISDQIIAWANKSEKEKDGRTLIQVIRLVFEKATDEAAWSEMYARLCRKMMEQISPKVQDDGIKNPEGKPIAGGQLFRKYLLNRCQEDFERGWAAKDAAAAAAVAKASEDEAVKQANDKNKDGEDEPVLYSEEYYAAQKAKRQGLGLIKFIGELFKLQMLTERIMHECVKKLLGNVENPEEEEIESLCKLLTTVGQILDTIKARAHMDVYFSRMKELTRSVNVSSRMQYMLQVYMFAVCSFYHDLALLPRMLSSCVIVNGSHVTRWQLRRRSPRYTKGYVAILPFTSNGMITYPPVGCKGSGRC
jgi:translation initiation factor 4G